MQLAYVLGCHLGWVNKRFCIQKGGSEEHISFITIMFFNEHVRSHKTRTWHKNLAGAVCLTRRTKLPDVVRSSFRSGDDVGGPGQADVLFTDSNVGG